MLAKEVVLEDAYKAQKYLVCEWLLSIYDEWDLNFLDNEHTSICIYDVVFGCFYNRISCW